MWHRINFFQLFIVSFLGQALKILQKFFLKIFSKKSSQQLSSNFSLDIWIDIGDFLNLEERQKLKLINHQICIAIENGMKKLWRTEEEAISAGDLLITAERVFLYRTNLIKMLSRQNLFLRTIVRAVENVNAGKLGIGDAIIVGCEYKPLIEGEKMANSDGLARIVNNLWTTVGKWIHRNDPRKEICNYHNVLRQYEERLLVTPGQLMWGGTHKIYIKGYTIVFKCHLENDLYQRWITSTKIPKELCLKSNSDRKVECCNTSENDAVFKFEDCFSLEILRPLEHCWPQQTNQQSFPNEMGPVHRGWLKEFDNFPSINLNKADMEYYDHAFFLRPQCHLDIAESNYILHMHFPIFDLSKKPHIFVNEQGLHFCDEQKLDFPFGDPTRELRKVFHRLIKLPVNYKKNSLEWKQKEYPNERYFLIKI